MYHICFAHGFTDTHALVLRCSRQCKRFQRAFFVAYNAISQLKYSSLIRLQLLLARGGTYILSECVTHTRADALGLCMEQFLACRATKNIGALQLRLPLFDVSLDMYLLIELIYL